MTDQEFEWDPEKEQEVRRVADILGPGLCRDSIVVNAGIQAILQGVSTTEQALVSIIHALVQIQEQALRDLVRAQSKSQLVAMVGAHGSL